MLKNRSLLIFRLFQEEKTPSEILIWIFGPSEKSVKIWKDYRYYYFVFYSHTTTVVRNRIFRGENLKFFHFFDLIFYIIIHFGKKNLGITKKKNSE